MPSKEEKKRRRDLVQAMVAEDTKKAIAAMPLSLIILGDLFDHLDIALGEQGCDHTSKLTTTYLEAKKLNTGRILPWLGDYGGYCDCEVLANVEEKWEGEIEKARRV